MKKIVKKLYEYKLVSTDADEEYTSSKTYYFQKVTTKGHNEAYTFYDVPRKLVKIRGSEVIEVPFWWSGNINRFKKI
tara:strand:+ start:463 stop:693 length:231 start_codon:yes stop_codon:yes gene_type:complete